MAILLLYVNYTLVYIIHIYLNERMHSLTRLKFFHEPKVGLPPTSVTKHTVNFKFWDIQSISNLIFLLHQPGWLAPRKQPTLQVFSVARQIWNAWLFKEFIHVIVDKWVLAVDLAGTHVLGQSAEARISDTSVPSVGQHDTYQSTLLLPESSSPRERMRRDCNSNAQQTPTWLSQMPTMGEKGATL